jgi:hypothetical protein
MSDRYHNAVKRRGERRENGANPWEKGTREISGGTASPCRVKTLPGLGTGNFYKLARVLQRAQFTGLARLAAVDHFEDG